MGSKTWERRGGKKEGWSRRASECRSDKFLANSIGSSGAHTTIREVPHGQTRLGPSSPANEMGASWEECGLGWKAQVDSEGRAS